MDHPDALSLRELIREKNLERRMMLVLEVIKRARKNPKKKICVKIKRKNQEVRKIQVKKFQAKNVECKKTFSLKELLAP